MIYQGSKAKLRKYIVPVLQDCIDRHGVTEYVEPFVVGANIIDHIRCEMRTALALPTTASRAVSTFLSVLASLLKRRNRK